MPGVPESALASNDERPRPRVLINALALRGAADAARVFLENLICGVPRAWPAAEFTVVLREGTPLPAGAPPLRVVPMTSSGSGIARVGTELVRLPRVIRRLSPHVVLNPNESIPRRLNCGLVVISQNLFFHCPAIGPLGSGPHAARIASRLQFLYYRRQMPRSYVRADAVIPVSAHAAHELAEHAGLDLSRAHVAHYGADRLPVRDRPPPGSPRVLLVVGAIAHYKRLREAVEALRMLRDQGGDYELHLAGEPWPGYREEVAAAAARSGVDESVRFLGALGDDELADAYATSHAGLALSQCESFGIPVVEGMRAGLPHVVADERWSAETVGAAAVRVDGASPAAVADGVRSLDDPAEWQRRADAGRRAVERYTWKAQAEAIAGVTAAVTSQRLGLAPPSGSVRPSVEHMSTST